MIEEKRQTSVRNPVFIKMGVADPNFPTDPMVREAFDFAIVHGCTHYTSPDDFDEYILPKAISKFYESSGFPTLDPLTQIKATRGAQEALSLALHTSCKPGNEIVLLSPTYSAFIDKLPIFQLKPIFVFLIKNENWKLDIDSLRSSISENTKMIFICDPNNPTGTALTKEDYDGLRDILMENKRLSIIVDECYSRILYEGKRHYTLLQEKTLIDRIFVVNSFSKTYAMTGWRLGYLISGKENIEKIKRLSFEYSGGVSYALQYAGATALQKCGEFVEFMVAELSKRRSAILYALSKIEGVKVAPPMGGFEVFPDFGSYMEDSTKLSLKLKSEMNIETIPGIRFGPNGEGHLRLVFCSEDITRIKEGIAKISESLRKLKN